ILLILTSSLPFNHASDPDPQQDFCIAASTVNETVFVNGLLCKDPSKAVANDFYLQANFTEPANASNPLGLGVTRATVAQFPGLNTLGVSFVRFDYAPKGINPPHIHPRASEILFLLNGKLNVGFVTSNPSYPTVKNKLFEKNLSAGDLFVFPKGLIHYQYNYGNESAVAFAALGSQSGGLITVANAVFGSDPFIDSSVLEKAFGVGKKEIVDLEKQF
ncbi:hypothetical protein M569_01874, partial [Genlisea aurea]